MFENHSAFSAFSGGKSVNPGRKEGEKGLYNTAESQRTFWKKKGIISPATDIGGGKKTFYVIWTARRRTRRGRRGGGKALTPPGSYLGWRNGGI